MTVTPGIQLTAGQKLTRARANLLGTPTVTLDDGEVTPTKLAASALALISSRVLSMADLRALAVAGLANGTVVQLLGYYTPGDGGGGLFHYDNASAAADNGGTVIVPTVGTGRWIRNVAESVTLLQFGAKADSATINTTAIQAAFNSGKRVVINRGGGYYRADARITALANTEIFMESGAEIRWTATTANGTAFLGLATRPGIEVTGDRFKISGFGKLTGPTAAGVYVANECAIFAKGTSTTLRKSFFTALDVEMSGWGAYGICHQFVDMVKIIGTYVHDCGYAGISICSGTKGEIQKNRVHTIAPGSGGNAYGITLNHDSTNYNLDPNAATNGRLVVNPFCIDWDVSANEVCDIPLWVGIDAHGGYECRFHHNSVYNTLLGIALASGSGAATNYAGENNVVSYNNVTTKKRDGTATTVAGGEAIGITVNGGSVVAHRNVEVVGNTIDGCGGSVNWKTSIWATLVSGAVIAGNIFRNWKGGAIYTFSGDGAITGNIFENVSVQAGSTCVYLDSPSFSWNVTGNKHEPQSGTVAAEGVRVSVGNTARHTICGNDFSAALSAYVGATTNLTRGNSDSVPQITLAGTPTVIAAAVVGNAPRVWVEASVSGVCTISDITDPKLGQMFTIYNPTANNVTFDRSNSALAGGVNAVLNQYDTLTLLCVNTAGVKFVEIGRAANS